MLLGRGGERARIDLLLRRARGGVGGALMLRGEPGIGKSALLEYARGHAVGMRVVNMHCPALPEFPEFGESAALDLLRAGGHTEPLLVLVDDAHRLDERSLERIGLAAPHLGSEAVALLCATQENRAACALSELEGMQELGLKGLDRESARELLARLGGWAPDAAVLEQLLDETGGNPLALRELVGLLRETQIAGEEPLASPLPAGARVAQAFLRPVRNLPDPARTALLVAAAAGMETSARIAVALHLLDRDRDGTERLTLEPAEAAGIVERDGDQVRVGHPIVRSAVYHCASADARRAAHLALARALALLPGPQAADRRAWHRAAATASSPSAPDGAAVEAAALQAYSRRRYAVAAQGLELTAGLVGHVPDQADRGARCLLRAASGWHLVGRSQQADRLLGQALGGATDAWLRADIIRLRGQLWTWTGQPAAAHRLLVSQAAQAEALDDTHRSALLLVDAAIAALLAGDGELASGTARRAKRLAAPLGGPTARAASLCADAITVACGNPASASPLTGLLSSDGFGALDRHLVGLTAQALIWLERYEIAEQALGQIVEQARTDHAPGLLPVPLALLAEAAFRTGRWAQARRLAVEATDVGERVGQPGALALGLGCLARLDAARGLQAPSPASAAAVELAAGSPWSRPQTAAALGLLALGIGETHEAIRHLETAAAMLADCGLRDPSVIQWAPDLIEAYVRAGRIADARCLLAHFETQAERTERTWALAATARCRGLLASEAEFAYHFAAAFRWHNRTETPFELARTALCLGARLRRAGRRPEARVHLRAALVTLERLGATPWAQRARAELRMAGDQTDVESWAERRLTPKETEVAWLVAQGRTNREVANALGVTPRTVAFHLGNIYRKLDVRSRADLSAARPTRMLAG